MSAEEEVGFEVTEETVLTDFEQVQEQRTLVPVSQGVHVRIEKAVVRKSLEDNAKDAPKEGPENKAAYKYLHCQFRIVDGISVPVYDDDGNPTGETELKYKNKVVFPGRLDLAFWHNPEVKTSDWWRNRQYAIGFKQMCVALGFNLKELRINDAFLLLIDKQELLLDIGHEEEQELKEGSWVGKGTFKERLKNFRKWS